MDSIEEGSPGLSRSHSNVEAGGQTILEPSERQIVITLNPGRGLGFGEVAQPS